MSAAAPPATRRVDRLWVFDFDWSVVNENSDYWIHRTAPGGSLPPHIRDSYVAPDWIGYMNRVIAYLAEQGVTAEQLQRELQAIPWTPGMRQLLEAIRDSNSSSSSSKPSTSAASVGGGAAGALLRTENHAAILSDANALFIRWILDADQVGTSSTSAAAGDSSTTDGNSTVKAAATAATATTQAQAAASSSAGTGSFSSDGGGGGCGQGGPGARANVGSANSTATTTPPHAAAAATSPPAPLSSIFICIVTNGAEVDGGTGRVRVWPHHGSAPGCAAPPHACATCNPNLCKRAALDELLREQARRGVSYRQLVYVGDGRNDLCPCLALQAGDVAMPRVGFALHKLLAPLAAAAQGKASTGNGATAGATGGGDGAAGAGAVGSAGGQGDDAVYPAIASGSGVGARAGAGAGGERALRAACVPWSDAHDILRWVREWDAAHPRAEVAEEEAALAAALAQRLVV